MNIIDVEQGTEEWLELRRGKISGTVLGDLYSKRGGRKIGFYQVIAERIGLDPDEENRMDRGLRLEDEAIALFEKKTRKRVERAGLCVSDFNKDIINSPDGIIQAEGLVNPTRNFYTEAVEVKCLSPARHLQAVIEDKVPDEFESQKMQYFIVNDDLKVLHFVFYDPRIPALPFHVIKTKRKDVEEKIELFKKYQIETLEEIEEIIERLTF